MDTEAREQMKEKIRLLEDEVRALRSEIERNAYEHPNALPPRSPVPFESIAADLTNDFNNVLQSILGHIQMARLKRKEDRSFLEMIDEIERIIHRGSQLTYKYLHARQKKQIGLLPLDMNRKIREMAQNLGKTLSRTTVIEFELARDLKKVSAEDMEMEQLVMHLAIHAESAMPDGGKLVFKTENVILKTDHPLTPIPLFPGEYVLLSLSDIRSPGSPVPGKDFVLGHEKMELESEGFGIDISLAKDIAKKQGGYIDFCPIQDHSITYNLYLPAWPEYAA